VWVGARCVVGGLVGMWLVLGCVLMLLVGCVGCGGGVWC
jgi:hypothetical protein